MLTFPSAKCGGTDYVRTICCQIDGTNQADPTQHNLTADWQDGVLD